MPNATANTSYFSLELLLFLRGDKPMATQALLSNGSWDVDNSSEEEDLSSLPSPHLSTLQEGLRSLLEQLPHPPRSR
ncbi:unnamed protein product [Musa acuminata var. zebrina]